MFKHAFCILFILSLIPLGCSKFDRPDYLYVPTSMWKGKPIDELIEQEGYPTESFIAPNGNKVYVYTRSYSHTKPSMTMPMGSSGYYMTTSPQQNTHYCRTFFETDNNGIIVRTRYQGNDCD